MVGSAHTHARMMPQYEFNRRKNKKELNAKDSRKPRKNDKKRLTRDFTYTKPSLANTPQTDTYLVAVGAVHNRLGVRKHGGAEKSVGIWDATKT